MVKKISKQKKEFAEKTKKNVPEGVIIISVLIFAGSLVCALMALTMFNAADQYNNLSELSEVYGQLGVSSITFVNLGLLFVALTLVSYLIGRGLIKLQNRTRIVLIVLLSLSLVFSLYSLVMLNMIYMGLLTMIILSIMLWYLLRKDVANNFS